jgi:hypothetical protein
LGDGRWETGDGEKKKNEPRINTNKNESARMKNRETGDRRRGKKKRLQVVRLQSTGKNKD